MNLSNEQYTQTAYLSFYWTLHHIFEESHQPVAPHPFSLCDLLSNMCPCTFQNNLSADPAVYCEYAEVLQNLLSADNTPSILLGYQAGREFIQLYMDEYEYDLEKTLQAFSLEDYTYAFEKRMTNNEQTQS